MAKSDRKTIDQVFILLGLCMTAVLLVIGLLAWQAYSFATTNVKTELAAQQIFFPKTTDAAYLALPADDQAAMAKYAGMQLTTGDQAKVYANNFIAFHLTKVAGGLTYSQASAKAMADPTNTALQGQVNTLFKGETLRGLLLGDGYTYWTMGMIARYAAITAFVGAAVMGILVLMGLRHLQKTK